MAYAFLIEPDAYAAFDSEDDQLEQCKAWGLLSEKATRTKSYTYKGHGLNLSCTVIGYVDEMTAVIEFETSERHCIHPAYLKEMQASTFTGRLGSASDDGADGDEASTESAQADAAGGGKARAAAVKAARASESDEAAAPDGRAAAPALSDKPRSAEAPIAKPKRTIKLQLPEEKVKMTATVQALATVPNHFTEEDDEIVIYEAVSILEPPMEVGEAWSSHSNTLKKLELQVGDTLTFECKIVAKKLTKHPVAYKINNPAKIQKV
ncbi:hypothetical protein [Paenibacillus sp. HJGM_3]|uniref:hypothetical protein n=1 Tax=Paenibacillus sp. HJGM_3 TaxID=3379816 RepID=UPI00385BAE20